MPKNFPANLVLEGQQLQSAISFKRSGQVHQLVVFLVIDLLILSLRTHWPPSEGRIIFFGIFDPRDEYILS